MTEREELEGIVSSVVYQNDMNGYTVLALQTSDFEEVVVVGCIPGVAAGENLYVQGSWTIHPSYGEQFKVEYAERSMPDTRDGIFMYLASGTIKGIGVATATKIVERFGTDAIYVIEREPERLAEIKGVTVKKAKEIGEEYASKVGLRRLMEFLVENNLPIKNAMRLYRFFGNEAMRVLERNPYILISEEYNVPFSQVDAFALEQGFDVCSDERVEAGIIFELLHNLNNGHTFLPRAKLSAATAALLALEQELTDAALVRLQKCGKIICCEIAGVDACYLPELHEAENYVAERIKAMIYDRELPPGNIEKLIDETEKKQKIQYARAQREAVRAAAEHKIMILTGGPGTGKTTSLKGIVSLFENMDHIVLLAAPTGRAAKRMSELGGSEASTIHRLLEAGYDSVSGEMVFNRDEKNMLEADVVIVDEASMIDIQLMYALLKAIPPECRLILIGDADQLPPVGGGNPFLEMIRSEVVETVKLTEIFRQAQKSDIIMNAHNVNCGEMPNLRKNAGDFFFMKRKSGESAAQTIVELCATRLPKNMGMDVNHIQVLSPHRKGDSGTQNLNRLLQAALNPPGKGKKEKKEKKRGEIILRTGDRVMQIKNNYDILWKTSDESSWGTGVFNGDIGRIEDIDEEFVTISFDDRIAQYTQEMLEEIELAYAVTVHKSQGSEYRCVVFAMAEVPRALCYRGVMYTGLTRARELMVVVGDDEIVFKSVSDNKQRRRYSGLRTRLVMQK